MKYVRATVPTTVSLALTLLVGCNDSTPPTDLERAIASLPPSIIPAFDPDVLRSRGGDPPAPAPNDGTPRDIAPPGSTPLPTRRLAPIRVPAQPAPAATDPDEGQSGTPAGGGDPPRGLAGLFRRGINAVSRAGRMASEISFSGSASGSASGTIPTPPGGPGMPVPGGFGGGPPAAPATPGAAQNGVQPTISLTLGRPQGLLRGRSGNAPVLTATIELQGAVVADATAYGSLTITTVQDDQGNALTRYTPVFDDPAEEMVAVNRNMMYMGEFNPPNDKIKFDIVFAAPAAGATSLATLNGSVALMTGGTSEDVLLDGIAGKAAGEILAHPALQAAGLAVKVTEPAGPNGIGIEITGPSANVIDVELVGANGQPLNSGSSWSSSGNTTTYNLQPIGALPADAGLKISVQYGQKPVTIPLVFENVALPDAAGAPPAADAMPPGPSTRLEPPAETPPPAAPNPLLGRKVQLLLRTKCYGCHSNRARRLRGGFNMEAPDALAKGGESGQPAVVPGDPDQSPLYRAVTRQDPDFSMPPPERDRLTSEQVELIKDWIAAGAPLQ